VADERETWWLDDVERLHEENPDSFFVPGREKRQALRVGDSVKLVFRFSPSVENVSGERMWVEVTSADGGEYTGRLLNEPSRMRSLRAGDSVSFGPQHVAAYAWSVDELGWNPNESAWARIESSVPRGTRPAQVSLRPPESRAEGSDSGWTLGRGDETRHELSDESIFRWFDLGWLADLHPELEAVFRAGAGIWRWDDDAGEYVRVP
jgi:hypothetical protein